MKTFLVTILVVSMICPSIAELTPQQIEQKQAIMDATRDANQVNAEAWALVGCIGIVGVAGAYIIEPSVPPIKLLGKSPEYVAFYTDTYKQKVKEKRTKHAVMGCLATNAVLVFSYIILIDQSYNLR